MTVSIVELTNDLRSFDRDPAYNPNVFSESDDEIPGMRIPDYNICRTGNVDLFTVPID